MNQIPTYTHSDWAAFMKALQTVVQETSPGQFQYYFSHPTLGIDDAFRGYFPSYDAAMASAVVVQALKWPEPKI